MIAIDTNVWVYSHDSRERRKQQIAQQLVDSSSPLILPWQVGCEFVSASRKLAPLGFTEDETWNGLDKMRTMADLIALPDPVDWTQARTLQKTEMLSFWDSLLVATCLRIGVKTPFTEDMGSPRMIRSLELINPFA